MSNIYVAGDLHLGHKNICKFRTNFSTAEEHDATVLHNILSTCRKRDTLILLGDCFFTKESLNHLRHINKYVGSVKLVLGNHDTDNDERKQNIRDIVNEQLVSGVYGLLSYKGVWLSHAPIHPDELRGRNNVHGHTHAYKIKDDRYRCVSLEQIDYKPLLFQEAISQFKKAS